MLYGRSTEALFVLPKNAECVQFHLFSLQKAKLKVLMKNLKVVRKNLKGINHKLKGCADDLAWS
jgi:hypothetical protein